MDRRRLAQLAGLLVCMLVLADTAQAGTVRVSPGANLNSAYQAAQPGDVIECAPGGYGSQSIDKDPDKPLGSQAVVFRCAGASFSGFTTWANDVRFADFKIASPVATVRAGRNVTLRRFQVERFDIFGPASSSSSGDPIDNMTVVDGDFGLVDCAGDNHIAGPATNVKVLNNRFRDHRTEAGCPGKHLDCLHTFNDLDGLTIAGNTFAGCVHMGVLVNGSRNILVENNFFWGGIDGFKLRSGPTASGGREAFDNVTIRHNSGDHINLGAEGDNSLTGVLLEANATLDGVGCRSGTTYRNNLAEGGRRCSSADLPSVASIGFANPAQGDFHISRSSPAANRIATGPSTDLNGETRPQGPKHDVGADEVTQPGPDREGTPRSGILSAIVKHVGRWLPVTRRGFLRLRLACRAAPPAPGRCNGTVSLRRQRARHVRRPLLGRARFSTTSDRVVRVKLRLRRAARRAVRRHRVHAKLRVVVRAGATTDAATKRVILVRRR
jgi:hypothetical protein